MTIEMMGELMPKLFAIMVAILVTFNGIAYLYTTFIDIVFVGVQDHTNPTKGDE